MKKRQFKKLVKNYANWYYLDRCKQPSIKHLKYVFFYKPSYDSLKIDILRMFYIRLNENPKLTHYYVNNFKYKTVVSEIYKEYLNYRINRTAKRLLQKEIKNPLK